MYKITIIDYKGKEVEVVVSAEVFEIFEDSRKQDLRERNEMRRHRDYRGLQNYYVLQELASSADELENDVSSQLLLDRIFGIVKTCTPVQQERFYLYYLYGYTMREIAKLQKCSHPAVVNSIEQILRKIKKSLKQGYQNAEL